MEFLPHFDKIFFDIIFFRSKKGFHLGMLGLLLQCVQAISMLFGWMFGLGREPLIRHNKKDGGMSI